ncbi:MAG: hypothetical protein HPY44_00220 [Armatimonadetes bacterium]|nr:hypothetical protein [Armatimonadota bacterium]
MNAARNWPVVTLFAVVAMLSCGAGSAWAQGIESYALVHPFGLSSAATTRLMGMGGPVSCVWDRGFANPAFAAMQTDPNASVRYQTTDFSQGPDLDTYQLHYILPLTDNESGLQFSFFDMSGDPAATRMQGGPMASMSEQDLSVHYGRRIDEKLTAGIGVSAISDIDLSLMAPGMPLLNISSEADWGARLGVAYEHAPGVFLGAVYDYYQETATATGALVGGGPVQRVFWTDLLALGVSWNCGPKTLVAVEYRRSATHEGPTVQTLNTWHAGAEYDISNRFALRAGMNDSRLTFGLGYQDRCWDLSYAYINRWNDDIATGLFGPSDSHGLQATYRW